VRVSRNKKNSKLLSGAELYVLLILKSAVAELLLCSVKAGRTWNWITWWKLQTVHQVQWGNIQHALVCSLVAGSVVRMLIKTNVIAETVGLTNFTVVYCSRVRCIFAWICLVICCFSLQILHFN